MAKDRKENFVTSLDTEDALGALTVIGGCFRDGRSLPW